LEYVLEESADELHCAEGHGSPSIAVGLFVAEEYGIVFDLDDSVVGDGDPKDIGGEILDGVGAIPHSLGIDVPGDVPDFRGDLVQEAFLFHFIMELGPEEDGEGFDGEEEIRARGMPGVILAGDGTSRDDIVDVGVVVKLTAPGVKDSPEACYHRSKADPPVERVLTPREIA
jgi:hypothetical protein